MKNQGEKINVLMAAAECAPFIKVGGLADVVGSLPLAMKKKGVDARVIMPLYGRIDRKKYKLKKIYSDLEVPSGSEFKLIDVYETVFPETDVKVYFIANEEIFGSKRVYKGHGKDEERFLFFSMAALYAIPVLGFHPHLIHCHDSHTGMIPDLIKVSNLDYVRNLKTLFTIHNFYYQGVNEPGVLSTGNLHPESLQSIAKDIEDGDVNFMVQAVLNADLINTVSKTYSKEICTSSFGAGLERVIRKRKDDLFGILNGIDVEKFDPKTDKALALKYSEKTIHDKVVNKIKLQKELGLPTRDDVPLCSCITRLVWQKGLDLIDESFLKLGCQFVFLGTGARKYEKQLSALQEKYPELVRAEIRFDAGLAQRIYAGSDIFLMPSRFEPCGLGQMIAMRYGTIPVVRSSGGLSDTVNKQTGFVFQRFEKKDFYEALENAVDVYQHMPKTWKKMQERAMRKDFSWDKSAEEYKKLYKKLIKKLQFQYKFI